MNSTLDLIYSTPVLPERNFKLESINDIALSSYDGHTLIQNFQYIKHSLDLTIKVDLSQTGLDYINANNINYITIQNSGTNSTKVGYFVINKKWLSDETIQFVLRMDTINSFLDQIQLSDKTRILRQHKDRFEISGHRGGLQVVNRNATTLGNFAPDVEADDYIKIWSTSPCSNKCFVFDFNKFLNEIGEEMDLGVRLGYEEAYEVLTCKVKMFWADENFYCTEIPNSELVNIAEDFSVKLAYTSQNWRRIKYWSYTAEEPHWHEQTFNMPASAKYLVIVCDMTFDYDEATDEESIRLKMQFTDWENPEFDWDIFDYFKDRANLYLPYLAEVQDIVGTLKFMPIIDRYSEAINPVLYGGVNIKFLEDSKWLDQSWYLVYENQNSPTESLTNPVDCYVYAGKGAKVASLPTFTGTKTIASILTAIANINGYATIQELEQHTTDVSQLTYLYIPAYLNQGARVQFSGEEIEGRTLDITFGTTGGIIFYPLLNSTSNWQLLVVAEKDDGTIINIDPAINSVLTFTAVKTATIGAYTTDSSLWPSFSQYNLFGTSGTSQSLYPITSVDKTDPKIIKIIKLPYCPANITIGTGGLVDYDSDQWEFDALKHALKLKNFNTTFARVMSFNTNPLLPLMTEYVWEDVSLTQDKNSDYEFKLYHSDFYQPKFIYDSFAFTFQLELITQRPTGFRVQFNATNTLNSRFLFTFLDYKCDGNEIVDFNNILYVSRNNECALFNQQYVNYIRNGYNYDRKNLEITRDYGYQELMVKNILGAGRVGMSAITSLGGGAGIEKVASSVIQGVYGIGSSAVQSHMSIVHQVQMSELALAERRNQLANQSTGVIDANDVDLLDAYSQNKAKFKVYKVSPRMKKALFNLFYYTGYICEEQGLPDTTSRLWFNFVSADIVLKKVPNLSEDIINDIKIRYNAGITFLHNVYVDSSYKYDFDQKYENWENSILQAIGG